MTMKTISRIAVLPLVVLSLFAGSSHHRASAAAGSEAGSSEEWASYGGTNAGMKYSPLDQINRETVKRLQIAWRQSVTPTEVRAAIPGAAVPLGGTKTTPLMAGGLLYMYSGAGTIMALDAATGEVVWFDVPPERNGRRLLGSPTRHVAYWKGSGGADARVIGITGTSMVALNAKTGKRYADFGDGGEVNVAQGYDRPSSGFIYGSGPIVVGDVIVLGGMGGPNGDAIYQNGSAFKEGSPADIRGFDVRTGRKLWNFHTVPHAGEFGVETWLENSSEYSGDANNWAPLSADDQLGYVYAATGSATGDYWGGMRPGNNLFANSLLCLDAKTGKRIWHYQLVHHDLWDWDVAPNPVLLDITVGGRKIKAVAQATKHGFLFVFDRVTGKPVWPIEERPVPKGDVPREWYSPTQPVPTKPPAYTHQGITVDDLVDFTPELRQQALKILSQYRYGSMFTPPSLLDAADGTKGLAQNPGMVSTLWNGPGADPETGIVYVQEAQSPAVVALVKPTAPNATLFYTRQDLVLVPAPEGLPTILKPPYGSLVAIDLNKGEILWRKANGDGPRNHPALKHLNLPPLGQGGAAAPIVTKTMVFLADGTPSAGVRIPQSGGKMFRAYDKRTGDVLWEMELPGWVGAAPITYMVNNKQYIAMNVGDKTMRSEFIALALP
jgi:quinoprotein glucose dehydrogenase